MLTYKNTIFIFMLSLAALFAADLYMKVHIAVYVLFILTFLFILFYGSYFIHSGFFIPVTLKGDETKKQVALSFDDGPIAENTSKILDTLRKNQVTAAFFCIGKRMEENPDIVHRMHKEGHIIGNHSYSHHFFFDLFPEERMKSEIDNTNSITGELIQCKPLYFRPPYGVTTPVLARAIKKCAMHPIGWSLRSMDTMAKNEQRVINKIKSKLKAGDVILLHDTADVTVNGLQKIIDTIRSGGYELVRLDQLLKTNAYA